MQDNNGGEYMKQVNAELNKKSSEYIANLETEIEGMQERLNESYRDLGKSVLEILDEEGGEINALVDKIIEKSLELEELKKKI